MNKLTDIFDTLWLNLLIAGGAIAILVGFLFGWNICLSWQIIISTNGVVVIGWVSYRFVKICVGGIDLSDDDIPEIKPGPNHNVLVEFLQPATFAIFLMLICANLFAHELSPRWLVYVLILIFTALIFVDLDYYTKEREH